ncbi:hypothetical protein KDW60_31180, partial [Burkholderia cenocepacia]|uniref:hypothetical protein n=1 Tax=Burkholderia cenocepacia TaxID=95486 RepID=UPI001B981E6D
SLRALERLQYLAICESRLLHLQNSLLTRKFYFSQRWISGGITRGYYRGHFAIGHATGFGKLVDEKILPRVFGTAKLDAKLRKGGVLSHTAFDNIDHIVERNGEKVLLSQKASKWTIQLGQAVELNKSFKTLLDMKAEGKYAFDKIVVATFYGKEAELTDKYRVLRGITTGKSHDVVDISSDVRILAGKDFWTWIGQSEHTQSWVMEGILQAINAKKDALKEAANLMSEFRNSFAKRYTNSISEEGEIDWQEFLSLING